MGVNICKRCYVRYTYDEHSGDFEHLCSSGNPTLDQEDILVFSSRAEEFGATVDTGRSPSIITQQGKSNKLWGTLGEIEGGYDPGFTKQGNNAQLFRQRQHYEMIDDPDDKVI